MINRSDGPILVTGGAGYIGGQAVLCLLDNDVEVVVIDNLSTGRRHAFHDRTVFYEMDIHDQGSVEDVILRHNIKSILHFAGSIRVDESIEKPLKYYDNNTDASRRLIAACVNVGVEQFIFSSTAAVYGEVIGDDPVTETAITQPLNPYGWSKLFTERTLRDVSAAHGIKFGILRYFNVAGADAALRHGQYLDNPVHLIGRAIDAMHGKAGPLEVFGNNLPTPDGTGVRDYIHVSDLAQAHLAVLKYLIEFDDNLLLNLGYGSGHSVLDVINCLETVSGKSVPYKFVSARKGEAASVVADVSSLHNKMDWQPEYNDLNIIIQSALLWAQARDKNAKR